MTTLQILLDMLAEQDPPAFRRVTQALERGTCADCKLRDQNDFWNRPSADDEPKTVFWCLKHEHWTRPAFVCNDWTKP